MLLATAPASPGFAADVETVAKGLQFPEGTIFVGKVLYFVDYAASSVLRLTDGKVVQVWHQDGCGDERWQAHQNGRTARRAPRQSRHFTGW